MALRPCADCGHSISEHATACPQCGRPQIPLPLPDSAQSDPQSPVEPRDFKVALAFWIFFALALTTIILYVVESELGP
jgi:hypothetical protein